MKCPFLVRKKSVFDKEGRHISEELEIQECIKNECMVYDGATKLCSLLSANIKSGILIDDLKSGIKDLKKDMTERAEGMSVVVSTTIQTMQEAMISRFEILKKQNEIVVLGFDRLFESFNGKTDALSGKIGESVKSMQELKDSYLAALSEHGAKLATVLEGLKESLNDGLGSLKSSLEARQEVDAKIIDGQSQFQGEFKNFAAEYARMAQRSEAAQTGYFEVVRSVLEKSQATNQVGMETITAEIGKSAAAVQEIVRRLEVLETMAGGIGGMSETVKNEISGLKSESANLLTAVTGKFDELTRSFADTVKASDENMRNVIVDIGTVTESMKTELKEFRGAIAGKFDELGKGFGDQVAKQEARLQELLVGLENAGRNLGEVMKGEFTGFRSESTSLVENLKTEIVKGLGNLEGIKTELGNLRTGTVAAVDNIQGEIARSMESIVGIKMEVTGLRGDATSIMGDLKSEIAKNIETITKEITNLGAETKGALVNIQSGMGKSEDLFGQSGQQIMEMSDAMRQLNRNYLESLSKIAGLTEGMRKGVEAVGEGMQQSVLDLVGAMKKEIGSLESQYAKTFKDIAQLADKFEDLNKGIGGMTKGVQKDFKDLFDRQSQLAENTREILKNIREYFEKDEARYKAVQAEQRFKQALDHFDRSTLYYYRGNFELALNEIDKAVEINRTAEYLNLKGLILSELGKNDEAKKIYQEALKLEPNLAEIYNNLGLLHLKSKKIEDAAVAFQEALKRNVNYTLAYVHLGKVLLEMEKYDEAMQVFQRALDIDPANQEAREAIALYKEGKIGG
jgi:tetratricopeptide (TPR) repeat protein